ncbi:MAG: hypothetical protein AAGB12_06240 [Pseudomonadota bacterium]
MIKSLQGYKLSTKVLGLLSSFFLFSCITTQESVAKERKVEPLYAMDMNDERLQVRVYSGGCTKKEHFSIETLETEKATELTLVRIKPDFCKVRVMGGQVLEFPMSQIKVKKNQPIMVQNPFVMLPAPPKIFKNLKQ